MQQTTVVRRVLVAAGVAAGAVALTAGCKVQTAPVSGASQPVGGSHARTDPGPDAKPATGVRPWPSWPGSSGRDAPHGSHASQAPHVSHAPHGPNRTHAPHATRPAAPKVVLAPGAHGSRVRELQARLRRLALFGPNPTGYYGPATKSSVAAFQRGHGLNGTGTTDSGTWRALRSATGRPSDMELRPPTTKPLDTPDRRCRTGRVLCISKKSDTLAWMVDGKVVSAMDVRFGSQYSPTREGAFKVDFKSRDHVSTIYHSAMPYAMFFSGGQAVHYSSDFAARGYAGASHGCINVRDKKKIAALFREVRKGDRVVVYR
ncbi:L,D-transpeptidase family protein [Streptomyces sp. NPDC050610]|uniref:L,D-transpeptidase family protein n=1 Tax=Streptomyces sp. NPDC050610 TaxID=3157097 RepID=UPI0034333B30